MVRLGVLASGNSDSCMLIDVHAHFYHDRSPRADWRERNASRLAAGDKIGITIHVASILGSWGGTSPTYFPSPADLRTATMPCSPWRASTRTASAATSRSTRTTRRTPGARSGGVSTQG